MPRQRKIKWLDELQEFDFTFMMEYSICAMLADMLMGKKIAEKLEEQIKNGGKKQAEIQSMQNPQEEEKSSLYFDEAFQKSIGKGSTGMCICDPEGQEVAAEGREIGCIRSNNEA